MVKQRKVPFISANKQQGETMKHHIFTMLNIQLVRKKPIDRAGWVKHIFEVQWCRNPLRWTQPNEQQKKERERNRNQTMEWIAFRLGMKNIGLVHGIKKMTHFRFGLSHFHWTPFRNTYTMHRCFQWKILYAFFNGSCELCTNRIMEMKIEFSQPFAFCVLVWIGQASIGYMTKLIVPIVKNSNNLVVSAT